MKLFNFKAKSEKMIIEDHIEALMDNLKDASTENLIYFYNRFKEEVEQELKERELKAIEELKIIEETLGPN
jgi:glutamyl-tRNA reductase